LLLTCFGICARGFGNGDFEMTELDELIEKAKQRVAAMTPEEFSAMIAAQCESWVRGMTARCGHGEVDYEQCAECRQQYRDEVK
jgi:hypothetical protein